MPNISVATNDVLTATHFNTNYRDQVISTVTSSTHPSGTQGQFIYETDTNRLYVYTGAAWELAGRFAGLDNWTPTVTQSGAITVTVNEAKYQKLGRMCWCYFYVSLTSAGTGNNAITIGGLPFTSAINQAMTWGTAYWFDATFGSYPAEIIQASTTTLVLRDTALAPHLSLGLTSSSNAAAVASGDVLVGSFQYPTTT